ncbi:T9SS type A sorting domain-containing protein [uncultured Dokdonia sp.]|uniref:T9SS type A sorting domain-containing protein n=1 Tax=uncultured Dokdonia sp. TaxID=575653 RepID=UPI0026364E1A|nr:T9SS type A sorting domain-containing protein [uncultured Dokdonia sp.]
MKKIILILAFFNFINFNAQTLVLSHSIDDTTLTDFAVVCRTDEDGDGTLDTVAENSWWRSYTPSAPEFGISNQFLISGIQFISLSATNTTENTDATVRLHTTDNPFPTGNLTEIASESITLTPDTSTFLLQVNFSTPILVDADQEIAIQFEITNTDVVDFVQNGIGANNLGQTAPSYLSSAPCGIFDITDFNDIGDGFPDNNIVLNLVGEEVLSVDENTIEDIISLYPNPVQDILTIETQVEIQKISLFNLNGQVVYNQKEGNINRQIDISELSKGVYLLQIISNRQKRIYKVIKK